MNAKIPANIADFMEAHGVKHDEIWPVPGGKSYAIKHSAIERIAAESAVTFSPPQIVEANGADGIATIIVSAKMGEISTWSFGEASPKNNKNAYPFAMAEKRAKDRCVLKLLNMHGAIYSEDEADDLRQPIQDPDKEHRKAETITAYIEVFKTALSNAVSRDEVAPMWKEGDYARDKLGVKPGSEIYNQLHAAWVSRGKELATVTSLEGKAA